MASFSIDINAFCDKVRLNQDIVVRKIALELFSMVILKSPVDTGRFRGNWVTQAGGASTALNHATRDASGSLALSRASSVVASIHAGDVVYMSNNLPYAQRLEYGYSKQAPSGMVRTSMQRIVVWVNSIRM